MANAICRIMSPIGTFRRSCPMAIYTPGQLRSGRVERRISLKIEGGGTATNVARIELDPLASNEYRFQEWALTDAATKYTGTPIDAATPTSVVSLELNATRASITASVTWKNVGVKPNSS